MKKQFVIGVMFGLMMAFVLISTSLVARASEEDTSKLHLGVTLGYQGYSAISDAGLSCVHNTHPNDYFLPNAGVAGSAGKTDISKKFLSFGALGVRCQQEFVKDVAWNFEIGGLFGYNKDRKQNINDSRPAANGAFIYTEADFGMYMNIGCSLYLTQNLYIGVDGKLTGIYADSGWDRFGSEESAKTKMIWLPAICPKAGWRFGDSCSMEFTAILGKTMGGSVCWVFSF